LLSRAGRLSTAKAGNQNDGRALDHSKQERERGITIKSTGISLEFDVDPSFFARVDADVRQRMGCRPADDDDDDDSVDDSSSPPVSDSDSTDDNVDANDDVSPVELYLGNLPRSVTGDDCQRIVAELARALSCSERDVTVAQLNSKRHFAFVTIAGKAAKRLESIKTNDGKRDYPALEMDNCLVSIEQRGVTSVKHLAKILAEDRYPSAVYKVVPSDRDPGLWTGTATVEGLGLVSCVEPLPTRKSVREYLAKALVALKCPADASPAATVSHQPASDLNDSSSSASGSEDDVVADAAADTDSNAVEMAGAGPEKMLNKNACERVFTVNLVDSPGHVDFNAEVTSALRMTDGALVVVDVIDGVSVQTETVLRQALREKVRPVLMLNKVDRLLLQKQFTPEEVYNRFIEVIDEVNTLVAESPGIPPLSLEDGTVAFGSGYFQWGASMDTFVSHVDPLLSDRLARAKMRKRLAKKANFCKIVLGPIFRVHSELGLLHSSSEPPNDVSEWLKAHNAKIEKRGCQPLWPPESQKGALTPRKALKLAMSGMLPAATALVEMIAMRLPSPIEAQQLRVDALCPEIDNGDSSEDDIDNDDGHDDDHGRKSADAQAAMVTRKLVRRCRSDAPLVIYVSKICQPSEAGSRHGGGLAVCRCFSGTVRAGQMVRVAGPNGRSAKVTAVSRCVGKSMESVGFGTAGQIFALSGVAGLLRKNGTLTDCTQVASLKGMSFSVSPVVQKSVRPAEPKHLQKMVDALRKTAQADQTALFFRDPETGQHVLAGAGELHLDVLLNSVEEVHNVRVVASEPMVSFRESVRSLSSVRALKKSANKLNRVWFTAQPLSRDLVDEMDSGRVDTKDMKQFARHLVEQHGWDKKDAQRIWAIGPEPLAQSKGGGGGDDDDADASGLPTCILVNSTVGLQIPGDVQDTISTAFKRVCREGVLAGEQLYGVRFDLVDGMFHKDSNHRSGAQLDPAARSAMRGAFAYASPVIVEPLYRLEVTGPADAINASYGELTGRRRGVIDCTTLNDAGTLGTVVARMPIRHAFGLTDTLRGITSGKAFLMTSFSGWSDVDGDVLDADDGSDARELVCSIRKSKGKDVVEPPKPSEFVDKL
jgi:elongation factor 2